MSCQNGKPAFNVFRYLKKRCTSIAAVMQTRSRTVEMPSGLNLPLAFGINTRLIRLQPVRMLRTRTATTR